MLLLEAELSIVVAFSAGLLSFLSPCVLPLLPAYLSALGALAFPAAGRHGAAGTGPGKNRVLLFAFAFISGFAVVFISMGLAAGMLGQVLLAQRELIYRLGGAIIIGFALLQLGIIRFSFMQRSWHLGAFAPSGGGILSAFVMGVIFSAGWSPCVGPVLGSILLLAMGAPAILQALYLLLAYTLGLAVPFMLAAVFLDHFMSKRGKLQRFLPFFSRLSGIILLLLGIMLVSGLFQRFTALLQF